MSNIYLKIPGVTGSASTQGYQNSIALHSMNFNSERPVKIRVGNIN